MTSNILTFSKLRELSMDLHRNDSKSFLAFVNSLEGINIFEKFKQFLLVWKNDISYDIHLNLEGKSMKVQVGYIYNELSVPIESSVWVSSSNVKMLLNIPENFSDDGILPVHNLISEICIDEMKISLNSLPDDERMAILDNLPANIYNLVLNTVINDKTKVVGLDNRNLEKFKLNFFTNDSMVFLKRLVMNYDENYFRDILFHLSKRIDYRIIQDSTIHDVDYFVQKYSVEMERSNGQSQLSL